MRSNVSSCRSMTALAAIAVLGLSLITVPGAARAASSFEGERIKILVGFPPAGGHDLEARLIARHLPKYLPGKPSIIVQNMPGAGGMIMGAYVYNRTKPDGTSIGLFGGSHLQAGIIGTGVEYDIAKMPIIWGVRGVRIGIVRDFLKADSAKELTQIDASKIAVAGRSKTDSSCVMGSMAMTLLGIEDYKTVCAYAGTAVIRGAIERGEASYFDASDAHLVGGGAFVELYKKKQVIPIWQAGKLTDDGKIVRSSTVPKGVPTFQEAYQNARGKAPSGPLWDAFRTLYNSVHGTLNRVLVLPPGTPQDTVQVLRSSLARMADDQAFVRDWEKIFGQEFAESRVSAKEAEQVKDAFSKPAPWQDVLRKFLNVS
jgi:hypothetical protein